jgi:hypothetical protein
MEEKQRLRIPRLHFLTREKMEMIHGATLAVLKETASWSKTSKPWRSSKRRVPCRGEGGIPALCGKCPQNAVLAS